MLRVRLDEYLDDALDPVQRQEVESTLATDPAAAAMLARLKSIATAMRRGSADVSGVTASTGTDA